MQERKAELAAAIYADDAATGARFASEDIERLFAPLDSLPPQSLHRTARSSRKKL